MAICHKRDPDSRRKHKAALLAGPIALVVTGTAVAAGVLASDPEPSAAITTSASSGAAASSSLESRRETVSRADSRLDAARLQPALDAHQAREARAATQKAIRQADTKLWTTAPLYLWTAPGKKAMPADAWARGARIESGEILGATSDAPPVAPGATS